MTLEATLVRNILARFKGVKRPTLSDVDATTDAVLAPYADTLGFRAVRRVVRAQVAKALWGYATTSHDSVDGTLDARDARAAGV